MKFLEKITHRIKRFADLEQKNNVITVRNITPLFTSVKNNVKTEYLRYHGDRNDEYSTKNVFIDIVQKKSVLEHGAHLSKPSFIEAFNNLRDAHELPFSITEEIKGKNTAIECVRDDNLKILFPKRHIIRTSYFVSNSFSHELYYHLQRQHKIWFMKYGSYPGVYKVSDLKQDPLFKHVSIQSSVHGTYDHNVEKFKLFSLKDNVKDKEMLDLFNAKTPNRKKEVIPDVIECTIDLQIAALSLIFDAANLTDYYLALHRRIAPYQLALICNGEKERSKDLEDLAHYIELLVENTEPKVKVLNELQPRNYSDGELNEQLTTYDEIGVPYSIVLNEKVLENGLLELRNRNTTLSETIHLSDVTNYLVKIFTSG